MKNLTTYNDFLNEGAFSNWTKVVGEVDFNKFKSNWIKLDKKNEVKKVEDRKFGPVFYGLKKGSKEAEWKYIEDEYKLYSDMKDTQVFDIKNKK